MRSLAMNLLCLAVVMLVFLSAVTSQVAEDDPTKTVEDEATVSNSTRFKTNTRLSDSSNV